MSGMTNGAPRGFLARSRGRRVLFAREELLDRVLAAGLDRPEAWESVLGARPGEPGRGAAGRLVLDGDTRWVVKRMRRGGWTARLWRDRFLGAARLLRNLTVPIEAARRGVPTAAPAAMLLEEGPCRLYRAWLAVDEIPGAEDLLRRLAGAHPPGPDEIAEVLRTVRRMHDAGVVHRDLNLGNLLLRSGRGGAPEAHIVDLDRGRLLDGPVGTGKRRSALRRMERSYVKRFGEDGPIPGPRVRLWIEAYADGDPALASALAARSWAARVSLALHRLGWRG
jgi:tRNA A-37 threonylcarbamoyl transferase component Bud32